MKLHIGVDAALGLTQSLSTTAANSADAPRLDGVAGRDASRTQPHAAAKPGVRCHGLAKNHQRPASLLGFTNLLIAEPQLASTWAHCAPGPARPQPRGQPHSQNRPNPSSHSPTQRITLTAPAQSAPSPPTSLLFRPFLGPVHSSV